MGGYGFEVMRIQLLHGNRGQAIGLSDHDAYDDIPDGGHTNAFIISKMTYRSTSTWRKEAASASPSGKRHGPRFDLIGRLIGEGYYDLGNKAIVDEL